ncbi:MAG: hypothetical protein FWG87_10175 [Defluviitaleaceae bacterium]|nr:hypothetical protein [Defluviitaleaceae bacterium]
MDKEYIKHATTLNELFEAEFVEMYSEADKKKRKSSLPYLHTIYKRWYYASIVEGMPFSPANIMASMGAYYNEKPDQYPIVALRNPAKVKGVDIKFVSYSEEAHPIVDDLRKFIEYCVPYIDVLEDDELSSKQSEEIARLMHISDPHYPWYLLQLAIRLELLKRVPSLHVERLAPSKSCEKSLSRPNEEILHDIVEAAIRIAEWGLNKDFPFPEPLFPADFIRAMLAKPMEAEELFSVFYAELGFDMEEAFNISEKLDSQMEGLTSEEAQEALGEYSVDMMIVSGTFMLGVFLDRFFFTPFGYYLRLIRPMYAMPYDLDSEVGTFIEDADDMGEAAFYFFSPCERYTLTDLGLRVFNIEPNPDNYFDTELLAFEQMKDSLLRDGETLRAFTEISKMLAPLMERASSIAEVYAFRVRVENDKASWIHVHITGNSTLGELCEYICEQFDLDNKSDYSFYHDKKENLFKEYPSIARAAKTKSSKTTAEKCRLCEMDFGQTSHMLLALHGKPLFFDKGQQQVSRFELELLNKKIMEYARDYPIVARVSKKMEEYYD